MQVFDMIRNGEPVAEVVTGAGGWCVVLWPTSVVTYASERAARAVHIMHMGGRGEPTTFRLKWTTSEAYRRGHSDAYHDRCEGCLFASVGGTGAKPPATFVRPDYIALEQEGEYFTGYRQQLHEMGAEV